VCKIQETFCSFKTALLEEIIFTKTCRD